MRSHMGRDFGDVRIHTGPTAAKAARAVAARAFTVGRQVVFGAGEYAPGTPSGQRLMAHELTHVIQQESGGVMVQRNGRGTSEFRESVPATPTEVRPNLWVGEVEREEFVPATGSTAERVIHAGRVGLRYDSDACEVTIPYRVEFQQPSASNWPFCPADAGTPVPAATPSDRFDRIRQRFLDAAADWLNGWYGARLTGCGVGCADQDIPIGVEVTEDATDPDSTVVIANIPGRSCANRSQMVLHVGSGISEDRMGHEAGHAVLGHGDEYPEQGDPEERVRVEDWSLMSTHHTFGRRSLLHERHFQFVPAFLEAIHPGCDAELTTVSRPPVLDFDVSLGVGGTGLQGVGGVYFRVGADLGIPLDRLRAWEVTLGARGTFLSQLDTPRLNALLLGARVGLTHTWTPSTGGVRLGAFGELGGGRFQGLPPGTSRFAPPESGWLPYGEAGVSLGYSLPPGRSLTPTVEAEAAYGQSIGALDFEDAEVNRWFRVGVNLGLRF